MGSHIEESCVSRHLIRNYQSSTLPCQSVHILVSVWVYFLQNMLIGSCGSAIKVSSLHTPTSKPRNFLPALHSSTYHQYLNRFFCPHTIDQTAIMMLRAIFLTLLCGLQVLNVAALPQCRAGGMCVIIITYNT